MPTSNYCRNLLSAIRSCNSRGRYIMLQRAVARSERRWSDVESIALHRALNRQLMWSR